MEAANQLVLDAVQQQKEHVEYLHKLVDQIKINVIRKEGNDTVSAVYTYPNELVELFVGLKAKEIKV